MFTGDNCYALAACGDRLTLAALYLRSIVITGKIVGHCKFFVAIPLFDWLNSIVVERRRPSNSS